MTYVLAVYTGGVLVLIGYFAGVTVGAGEISSKLNRYGWELYWLWSAIMIAVWPVWVTYLVGAFIFAAISSLAKTVKNRL